MNNQVILKQPPALYYLFFTQMWERFSYYGMRALFILYMTKALLYGDTKAYAIYGAYGSLIYATPLIGGWLADRYLGYRTAVFWGGMLMCLGHFCMAVQNNTFFYTALALLIVGNGLLKPNIASLLGRFYSEHDPRRDAGFTLFYVGVNLGGFISPVICGLIGETWGWHYGFGIAGIGMLIGLLVFMFGYKTYEDKGIAPKPALLAQKVMGFITVKFCFRLFVLALVPLVAILIVGNWDSWVVTITGAGILSWLFIMIVTSPPDERKRLLVLVLLMSFGMAYWAFAEQAGSSLSLFTERNMDRNLWGFEIPTSLFQSVNPLFILLFGPLFANLWMIFARRAHEPSTAIKFSLGLFQEGLGFVFFALGGYFAAKNGGTSSLIWLMLGNLFMTTGELCVEPVGLAVVTRLSPVKLVGVMMGCWYLAGGSFSNFTAAWIASFTSATTDNLSAVAMAGIYQKVFFDIALAAFVIAFIILLLTPLLNKLMGDVRHVAKLKVANTSS